MATIKQIRWTIAEAAGEFGIDRKTLANRIRSKSIESGKDNKFSTLDICRAIFSDLEAERTLLTAEQKELTRIRKLQLARKLCVTETVINAVTAMLIQFRQRVMENPALTDLQKKEFLLELQGIPVEDFFPANAVTPEVGEDEE